MDTPTLVSRKRLFEVCSDLVKLQDASKEVLHEFADWYDGPGYFPSSFVAAIIRLRRIIESSDKTKV